MHQNAPFRSTTSKKSSPPLLVAFGHSFVHPLSPILNPLPQMKFGAMDLHAATFHRIFRVLFRVYRTHHVTSPWTTLVESSGENTVSFVCSDASLPPIVLRRRTLLRHFSRRLMYTDVVVSGLLRRRHSSYHRHVEPPLVIVRFRLLRRVPGILFQLRSWKSSHCLPTAGNWRQHCLPSLFRQTDRDII